jgi:hypothetical protein
VIFVEQGADDPLQTILFSCVPIRASWDHASEPNAKCFDNNLFTAIGMFNSVINILTDILFASLPIPMVWTLQVNIRTKLTLLAILSLGYLYVVPVNLLIPN